MRVQQAAGASQSGPMNWPPSARELDHFDVVDVPEDQRLRSAPTGGADGVRLEPATSAAPSSFERPDWGELRLRGSADEPPRVSRWWQALTVALALVAAAQGAYIWSLRTSDRGDAAARLRVDGPAGAEVRVDGQRIGPAPVEHTLAPGDYDVEIVHGGTTTRPQRVAVSAGRTTVLVSPTTGADTPPASSPAPALTASAPAVAAPQTRATAARPGPTPPDGVSATLGAVSIESTPAGLQVTMEGRERGVTPITIGRLKPGRHDVLVGGLARQVDVTANAVATLRVTRQ